MKVLVDVNVLLDLLLDRQPFVEDAIEILSRAEEGTIQGHICGASASTVFYVARKTLGSAATKKQLEKLLRFLEVTPVDSAVLRRAVHSQLRDFEDAVTVESAKAAAIEGIVTRNAKDFEGSGVRAYLPAELIASLEAAGKPTPVESR